MYYNNQWWSPPGQTRSRTRFQNYRVAITVRMCSNMFVSCTILSLHCDHHFDVYCITEPSHFCTVLQVHNSNTATAPTAAIATSLLTSHDVRGRLSLSQICCNSFSRQPGWGSLVETTGSTQGCTQTRLRVEGEVTHNQSDHTALFNPNSCSRNKLRTGLSSKVRRASESLTVPDPWLQRMLKGCALLGGSPHLGVITPFISGLTPRAVLKWGLYALTHYWLGWVTD
jgi:hypothetical protein